MSISLAAENDELLAEQDKLTNKLNASNASYQVMSDQNTQLRKVIEKETWILMSVWMKQQKYQHIKYKKCKLSWMSKVIMCQTH